MTTNANERPSAAVVLEDLPIEAVWARMSDAATDLLAALRELDRRQPELALDVLWGLREDVDVLRKRLVEDKGYYDQELTRRLREQGEDATQLAGETVLVKMKASPKYAYDVDALRDLAVAGLLTWEEHQALVPLVPTPDKRVFNELVKRGGALKAGLEAALTVTYGSPAFEAVDR